LKQNNRHQESRKMVDNQKCFSAVSFFAMVSLLSCFSPASSYFVLPRVSRTNDAIIIDYAGVGYAPFNQGRGYGEIADPGFIPVPAFNPYTMVQQQPMFYNGWSYFGRQATPAPTCGKGPAMPTSRSLPSERIAGGTRATKNAWPFIVALKKSDGSLFCAGTLTTDSKVLLAAQCLEKMSVFDISGVTVLVGMFLKDQSDVQMTRRISKVAIHSKFNAATFANDIAIITLDMPVVLGRGVGTVCLPAASTDPDQFADQNAVILGWDAASSSNSSSNSSSSSTSNSTSSQPAALEQALVTISSNADCRAEAFGQFVSDSTTCVSSLSSRFTCLKDVGGPVVINTAGPAPAAASYTIIGINSFTRDCSSGGLKTRVSAFRDWINTYNV